MKTENYCAFWMAAADFDKQLTESRIGVSTLLLKLETTVNLPTALFRILFNFEKSHDKYKFVSF